MRFTRFGKAPRFAWTPRKLAAANGRGARTLKRDQERYPLLADQMEAPPPLNTDLEAKRRDTRMRASEQCLRTFHAGVWRESRRDAQLGTPAQRANIRAAWLAWTGPTTSLYYRYIVDLHTGVMEHRAATMRGKEKRLNGLTC